MILHIFEKRASRYQILWRGGFRLQVGFGGAHVTSDSDSLGALTYPLPSNRNCIIQRIND